MDLVQTGWVLQCQHPVGWKAKSPCIDLVSSLDGAQKLEPFLGPMQIVSTKYKNALVVFYKAGEYLVLLSFDQSVETPFHTKLANDLARILY